MSEPEPDEQARGEHARARQTALLLPGVGPRTGHAGVSRATAACTHAEEDYHGGDEGRHSCGHVHRGHEAKAIAVVGRLHIGATNGYDRLGIASFGTLRQTASARPRRRRGGRGAALPCWRRGGSRSHQHRWQKMWQGRFERSACMQSQASGRNLPDDWSPPRRHTTPCRSSARSSLARGLATPAPGAHADRVPASALRRR
eukprot:1727809-Prymnesium_polylepis.1